MNKILKKQINKLKLQFSTADIFVENENNDFKLTKQEYKSIYRELTSCKEDTVIKISQFVNLKLKDGAAVIINKL